MRLELFQFMLSLLLIASHTISAFVSPDCRRATPSASTYTDGVLSAIPPRNPWDELKDRLSNDSSEKYSEGENLNYRPTFEIKEDSGMDMNAQRIESVKAFVAGALVGSLSIAPVTYLHYSDYNMAQFELSTDMAAIQAGLFAITYRYVSRKGDNNPMLSQGAVGAFALVRTLSNIQTPSTCTAFPLTCGPPLGYFNWSMITQAAFYGVESFVMFGVVAAAMEVAYNAGFIKRFG